MDCRWIANPAILLFEVGTTFRAEVSADFGHIEYALGNYAASRCAYTKSMTTLEAANDYPRTVETMAGLAQLCMANDDYSTALAYTEKILAVFESEGLLGVTEPFFVYSACYHVLSAVDDARSESVLQMGQRLLFDTADSLCEEDRHAFLQNIAVHQELLSSGSCSDLLLC